MILTPFAAHGFHCLIPETWELQVFKGPWQGGHLVFVDHRTPTLALTWERTGRNPDFSRTLRVVAKRLERDIDARLVRTDPIPGRMGSMARFAANGGEFVVAMLVPDPEQNLVIVLRQLTPGAPRDLYQAMESLHVYPSDAAIPWRFHGLALDLPPWWRLHSSQLMVGMARAVWFHRPHNCVKTHAVLVMRRYACASRLLDEGDVGAWLTQRLSHDEMIDTQQTDSDGTVQMRVLGPGSSLWRRLWRKHETRHLAVWVDDPADRLVVQEWKGLGRPLPPLRSCHNLKDRALPQQEDAR